MVTPSIIESIGCEGICSPFLRYVKSSLQFNIFVRLFVAILERTKPKNTPAKKNSRKY